MGQRIKSECHRCSQEVLHGGNAGSGRNPRCLEEVSESLCCYRRTPRSHQCLSGNKQHERRQRFNSIPKQLAKENKKFQYSKVKPGGRGETYLGSLQWLEDAGIICRCYNTDITGLPMEGNAKDNVFKVYTADIGLLIEMLGPGTRADILQGNLGGFKGAIFENLMADTLHKKQQSLYYFLKDSGLELDFLVRMKGECVPLEVKAKTAQAKSVQTVLKHADKYHVKHIIKFGDYNVGREGQLLTLPNYMQFLLDLEPEEIVLEPIDVDAVNALAKKILG